MKIIKVVPIDRQIFKEELTYFTNQPAVMGMMATINVRGRTVEALVVEVSPANQAKIALKTADFKLKKIERLQKNSWLLPAFIAACVKTARWSALPLGQVLKHFIPSLILQSHLAGNLPTKTTASKAKVEETETITTKLIKQNKFALQDSDEERIALYKSLTREAFAKKTSVYLCLPTVADIEKALDILGRGINDYTIVLHGQLGKKELLANWQRVLTESHPVLIVGTPGCLSVPRMDLEIIIVDQESADAYKDFVRPFIDARYFIEAYAEASGMKMVSGDNLLRVETFERAEREELIPLSPLKYRSCSDAEQKMMIVNQENAGGDINLSKHIVLSAELQELLAAAHQRNEQTFIFTARRGLAPAVICADCGTAVNCRRCGGGLVVHRAENQQAKNFYLCHHCGQVHTAEDRCLNCGGWRLTLLGCGSEKLEQVLLAALPKVPILRLDSDSANNANKARQLAGKFYSLPGSILVGTELAYYYLREPVANIALVAVDSLFSIPGFRTTERIFNLFLRLRQLAKKRFVIQTRYPNEPLFAQLLAGNLVDFHRQLISEREQYGYPPFKTLIKISRQGPRAKVLAEMKKVEKLLADYQPAIYPAYGAEGANKYTMHALLKLAPEHWVEKELLELLLALPPNFVVNVDPDDIL